MAWKDEVAELHRQLKRKPTLDELKDLARNYAMSREELEEQRWSWVRSCEERKPF